MTNYGPHITEAELFEALRIKLTSYIPHIPHEKQHAFLWLECFEALFGGAAGGGKSDALLMAALQWVDVPGYSALLLRKTFQDLKLPGSLIPRSHEWLGQTDARWNENDKQWRFPSGATINFGYMQTEEDRFRYRSSEFHFVGFDELTDFTRLQYTYMASRIRKPVGLDKNHPLNAVPLRLRGATNPGGRGNYWVKLRFIDRTDEPPDDPTQRIFIPSKLADNPSIDYAQYYYALSQLDESTRAQLLDGDWEAREPGEWMIPDPSWIDAASALGDELWRAGVPQPISEVFEFGIDWGEHTHGYIIWPLPDGGWFIPPCEVVGSHEDPAEVTGRILEKAERLGIWPAIANYDAAGVQSMRTFAATARKRNGWARLKTRKIAFHKYKKEAIWYMRLCLKNTATGKNKRVAAIHPDNVELIRQLKGWQRKNSETEDAIKEDDHGPDAVLSGIAFRASQHRAYLEDLKEKAKQGGTLSGSR